MTHLLTRLLRGGSRRRAAVLVLAAAACVLAGGGAFAAVDHLRVTTGWYWALETATTVGYGDVTPDNAPGRIVASLVMLTSIPLLAGAFSVLTGSMIAERMRRLLQVGARFPEDHYRLVLGMHPAIPVVLEELARAGDAVVLVADIEPTGVPSHVHHVRADPTSEEGLRAGRPAGADHILIAGDDDGDVLVTAVLVRQEAPLVPVTALVGSRRMLEALKDLGVAQVLSPDDLTGHTVAKGLEAPHAGEVLTHLVCGDQHRLVEHVVEQDEGSRLLSVVRRERAELVLGVVHEGRVSLGVPDDPEVVAGDVLLVVEANPDARPHRRHDAQAEAGVRRGLS
ncbi:MAG TPA: ion channel [Acidimicrobiales bacterium]|nr:ion channel [Acidimicrobiales bacterium]